MKSNQAFDAVRDHVATLDAELKESRETIRAFRAALKIIEDEAQRCVDEYISGKLVRLQTWSDRMAVALAKARKVVQP